MKGTIVVIAALLCAATSVYAKPLKVYLLLGQSNMEGHGVVVQKSAGHTTNGTLEYAVKQYQRPENWPVCDLPTAAANRMGCDAKGANFSLLLDTSGSWKKNELVWIDYHGKNGSDWGTVRRGLLEPGFGFDGTNTLGPELGIGTELSKSGDEILLLKVAWGGTALATDWRPPSSGGTVGWCYTNMSSHVHAILRNISAVYPSYDPDAGYELVGWFWHQGWNDGCSVEMSAEYQKNMANLVRDISTEFEAETKGKGMLASIAIQGTSGGWGHQPDRRLEVIEGQYNVSTYPENLGKVAAIETRGFWRDYTETGNGPINQGYHWNGNAESYYFIGTAAAQAMRALENGQWKQFLINATNNPQAV